ncbi:MAG: septum formation initiator family protein [Lachnospiraceae bacterium]
MSIIMLSVCVLTIGGVGLHNRDMEYRQQEQELMAQLESESARTEEIKAFKEHVGTQAYTEEIAKDKLGLAYPNEIIFKPQK